MDDHVKNIGNLDFTEAQKEKYPTDHDAELAVETLIKYIGDDPNREGLRETPARVVKAFKEIFSGYNEDCSSYLDKVFTEKDNYDDFVLVKNIDFFSHCEHHMVPFFGKVHLAYIPLDGIVGLSKLARTVDCFSKRLQTQEKLTSQIWDAINQNLRTSGIAIIMEAEHMCMSMRGINKKGTITVTSKFSGKFKEDYNLQLRFLSMIKN